MKYLNTKTGIKFESNLNISGGDWVPVEGPNPPKKEITNYDKITVAELKELLDEKSIEYNAKANKQELYDLIIQEGD